MKAFLGLLAIAFLFICFLAYGFQNVMFPSVIAVAADQAAKSIPGYEGQISEWMLSDKPGATPAASLPYTSSVVTPFDGYSGPTGFYSCGPYFIQMPEVVITTSFTRTRA